MKTWIAAASLHSHITNACRRHSIHGPITTVCRFICYNFNFITGPPFMTYNVNRNCSATWAFEDVSKATLLCNPHGKDKRLCVCTGKWSTSNRYGASLGGALCFINNPTLRLLSYLSTYDEWRRSDETAQKSTNNRQTPSPWWWSCLPLQRCGFDESIPPEGWAALRMFVPMPPSKRFNRFNKLK